MLRFARGGPAVLVAVSDERRPEQIARALAHVGLIPVLAFDEHELRAFMRSASFAGIVIDAAIDPEGAAVAPFAGRRDVVLCFLARETPAPAPRHVHAVLPADIAPLELASRVRALLELRATDMFDGELGWGGLQLDLRRRQARFDGDIIHLTPVQFRILAALVRAAERGAHQGRAAGRSVAALGSGRRRTPGRAHPAHPGEVGAGPLRGRGSC